MRLRVACHSSSVVTYAESAVFLTLFTTIHSYPHTVSKRFNSTRCLFAALPIRSNGRPAITMTTIVSTRPYNSGMQCVRCGDELFIPEWSEFRGEQEVHHVWHCWKCDYCFETVANIDPVEDIKIRDDIFPSLLVA